MTLKPPMDAGDLVRHAAFRLLLTRVEPISPATLVELTGLAESEWPPASTSLITPAGFGGIPMDGSRAQPA